MYEKQIVSDVYKEIHNSYEFDPAYEEILSILSKMKDNKNPGNEQFKKLLGFIEKYEPLTSVASNLISILVTILSS